jgi:phosphatidylinositol phospholipase C delta
VYHGKTFTTKVSLRKACEAIAKYAFVVSPYPIIISAEVHCSIPQQDMIASIMQEVFGDSLVSAPVQGRPRIAVLPSPEDLKGRILLKVCLEARPVVISVQHLHIDEKPICFGERGNAAQ